MLDIFSPAHYLNELSVSVTSISVALIERDFLLVVCLRDETKSHCLHQHTYTTTKDEIQMCPEICCRSQQLKGRSPVCQHNV